MSFFGDVFSSPVGGALGGMGLGMAGGPFGMLMGGVLGGSIGAGNQANQAQQDAFNAQFYQRQIERQQSLGYAQKAADYSAPTGQELAQMQLQLDNYQRTMTLQSADIMRQERLANAIDPALVEAGQQALQLLQGKNAPSMGPMLQQRALERQKLESSLQSQLGGGYASTTAGMQALNQFDQQSSLLTSQTQQQYMGNLLGLSAQVRPNVGGAINQNAASLSGLSGNLMSQYGNIQGRQQNAYSNLANASNQNSLVPYAGAPYLGNYLSGKMWGGTFNGISQGAGMAAGGAFGGPTGMQAGGKMAPQMNSGNGTGFGAGPMGDYNGSGAYG